jgi:hypothetical protein
MRRPLLLVVILALYALHQDVWFWRSARPLVLGFLPVGLAYHAVYCIAVALVMWLLTRVAWPSHLENAAFDPIRASAASESRQRSGALRGPRERACQEVRGTKSPGEI